VLQYCTEKFRILENIKRPKDIAGLEHKTVSITLRGLTVMETIVIKDW